MKFPKLPIPTTGFEVKFGDVNSNGKLDVTLILKLPGGLELPLGPFDADLEALMESAEDFLDGFDLR